MFRYFGTTSGSGDSGCRRNIDGNGKLNLVIDFRSDTGEFKVVLFLSSCALPGQPVQQVGEIDDQYDC